MKAFKCGASPVTIGCILYISTEGTTGLSQNRKPHQRKRLRSCKHSTMPRRIMIIKMGKGIERLSKHFGHLQTSFFQGVIGEP